VVHRNYFIHVLDPDSPRALLAPEFRFAPPATETHPVQPIMPTSRTCTASSCARSFQSCGGEPLVFRMLFAFATTFAMRMLLTKLVSSVFPQPGRAAPVHAARTYIRAALQHVASNL
jgi:hypothetical protein